MSESPYRKNFRKPRKSGAIRKIPVDYRRTEIGGGEVATESIPSTGSFSLGVFVKAGSRDDPPGTSGLAHFLEHSCFRRTKKRSSRQIATQFESFGAFADAFTTKEHTGFYVRALAPYFRRAINLLRDIVANPVFLEKEIEIERNIILEEIKAESDDPESLIANESDSRLFSGHPLASPIAGYAESVAKIQAADLEKFRKIFYKPENIVVAAAGAVEHEKVAREAAKLFDELGSGGENPERAAPTKTAPSQYAENAGFAQTHTLYSVRIDEPRLEENYALAALDVMLGGGMSSRLYRSLRERAGLAYSVYSRLETLSDCGVFSIYAATDGKNAARTEKLIFDEISKFCSKRIPKAELRRAKEQLKAAAIISLESMFARMESIAEERFAKREHKRIETVVGEIEAIEIEDVMREAEKILRPENFSGIVFSNF